ncbi:sporulation histidine kinase inhibitor Sda [Alteribacillus bidgolensis]|uniref:Developmental checkpoint coupling sporulation initiation to replication initiation n=1 Tax=Alteribacillus bidgolensis TaxID=930129 RepID=A0A1G8JL93_9BACI|nr:sporulation histidine kinase inhibitor Sda [Alteribacillus bidgolensis]SDI31813.1 developmental checkpoint coupling sporulation initiation to replication initiation [Alteribacillus bidgolensis]
MALDDLSPSVLLEAYHKAKEMNLDEDFITILKKALQAHLVHQ